VEQFSNGFSAYAVSPSENINRIPTAPSQAFSSSFLFTPWQTATA